MRARARRGLRPSGGGPAGGCRGSLHESNPLQRRRPGVEEKLGRHRSRLHKGDPVQRRSPGAKEKLHDDENDALRRRRGEPGRHGGHKLPPTARRPPPQGGAGRAPRGGSNASAGGCRTGDCRQRGREVKSARVDGIGARRRNLSARQLRKKGPTLKGPARRNSALDVQAPDPRCSLRESGSPTIACILTAVPSQKLKWSRTTKWSWKNECAIGLTLLQTFGGGANVVFLDFRTTRVDTRACRRRVFPPPLPRQVTHPFFVRRRSAAHKKQTRCLNPSPAQAAGRFRPAKKGAKNMTPLGGVPTPSRRLHHV